MLTSILLSLAFSQHLTAALPVPPEVPVSISNCASISQCEDLINQTNSRDVSPSQMERLVNIYQENADLGRASILQGLANLRARSRYDLRLSLALRLEGYSHEEVSELLRRARQDRENASVLLLGRIGTEQSILGLLDIFDGSFSDTLLDDALSFSTNAALPIVLARVEALLTEGRHDDGYELAQSMHIVGGQYDELTDPLSPSSLSMLIHQSTDRSLSIEARTAAAFLLESVSSELLSEYSAELMDLAEDEHELLAYSAQNQLMRINSSAVVPLLLDRCGAHAIGEGWRADHGYCPLYYLGNQPHQSDIIGERLVTALASTDPDFRNWVIEVLGDLQYQGATTHLRAFLHSGNWSDVLSAAGALRSLDDRTSIPIIAEVAEAHWYHYVRSSLGELTENWETKEDFHWRLPRRSERGSCESGQWSWQGMPISPSEFHATRLVSDDFGHHQTFTMGELDFVGTNRGEWGGELLLKTDTVNSQVLIDDNFQSVWRTSELAIISTGLSHGLLGIGDIYQLTIEDGDLVVKHLTQAPEPLYGGFSQLTDVLFAGFSEVENSRFVVVFDVEQGMLGFADCETRH
ncbi:HEAT repeat domain-containing protein [Maricaulis sp.]|uniref:HEAT repeat domain-containing protein n=1 Tax=Maricaulis sp. TaxID=1486257 RepID=UPI001B1DC228|nr:HEAT repeat domain-containing protein [Maricaulis sp.]MBO6796402.1 HEAT repeat domain-containing protein [Maricaulis sp.]